MAKFFKYILIAIAALGLITAGIALFRKYGNTNQSSSGSISETSKTNTDNNASNTSTGREKKVSIGDGMRLKYEDTDFITYSYESIGTIESGKMLTVTANLKASDAYISLNRSFEHFSAEDIDDYVTTSYKQSSTNEGSKIDIKIYFSYQKQLPDNLMIYLNSDTTPLRIYFTILTESEINGRTEF